MGLRRETDNTERPISATVTELQRMELTTAGENLLPLKAVVDLSSLEGTTGKLKVRVLGADGTETHRLDRDVVGGGTYTLSLFHAPRGFQPWTGAVEAESVVLEYESAAATGKALKTQLAAFEFPSSPAGTPSFRSAVGQAGSMEFPDGGAMIVQMDADAGASLLPVHGTGSFDATALEAVVSVRLLHETSGGSYVEVFRFEDLEDFHDGGVHLDQVVPGFDPGPDGHVSVDRVELWLDPTSELEVDHGDCWVGALEV